ncbi:MAG: DUF3592 domain-containing protein [Methylococcales bacterium]
MTKKSFFLALGIFMLITGCFLTFSRLKFVQEAKTANGIVTDITFGGSHPKIEFILPNKERITYYQGGLITGYEIGDGVSVLYLESDPRSTACIDKLGAIWAASTITIFVACILLLVACI